MKTDNLFFYLVIIAFLVGIILGLSRSNRQPIIQVGSSPNTLPENSAVSTGISYFFLFIILIVLAYFFLQNYDISNFQTSIVESPPRPYLYKASVPTTNTSSKEPLTTTSNSAQDALPSPSTLTPQEDNKVYEQLAAFFDQSNTEQAKAEYQHAYPGKRILITDIPNAKGHYLVFIELSEGYDANHFMRNHREKMPLRTKAEIFHLFSQPF